MNQKKQLDVRQAKKLISTATKDFETRLMKASNEFFTYLVLQDMKQVLKSEVDQWFQKCIDREEGTDTHAEQFYNEAALYVSELNELIEKIELEMLQIMDKALKIQQAMINSHKLDKPKIILIES